MAVEAAEPDTLPASTTDPSEQVRVAGGGGDRVSRHYDYETDCWSC